MRRAIAIAALLVSSFVQAGEVGNGKKTTVLAGERVVLDGAQPAGRGSRWVQLSGPELVFRGGIARGARASFHMRTNGVYRFAFLPDAAERIVAERVRVVETGRRAAQETVISGPILAGAGERVTLTARHEIRDHSAVVDERRRWRQIGGPRLRFTRAELAADTLTFVPDEAGLYRFIAMTSGHFGKTPWAVHTVEIPGRLDGAPERRPVATIAPVASVHPGEEVLLDGSRSQDPNGDELVHRWSQVSGPAGEIAGDGPRMRFTPAATGNYAFTLTVTDPASLASPAATVRFTVTTTPGLPRPDPDAPDPLDRPFTIRLENAPLSTLVRRLSDAGVTVRTSARLNEKLPFDKVAIDLWVVDMPVRNVLDWVGRILGAFYVIEEPGAVWFARDTKWLEREKPVAETYRIDAVWSEPGASGLGGLLAEAVRGATWAGSSMSVSRPDTATETVTAILPRSGQERLAGLLAELRRTIPSGPPPSGDDASLVRAMERPVRARYDKWPLRDISWDLARQARLPVGFAPLGEGGGERISLALGDGPRGEVPLARALDAFSRAAKYDGWRMEPWGAVWLFKGPPPPLTSECTWSTGEIRSYDTRMLEDVHGFAGPMIVHLVKRRCLPKRWLDPFSLLGYSRARRRLVVIHAREVQLAVAELLDRLAREGDGAITN